MARLPRVTVSFEFDSLLTYVRRCAAPNAKYHGFNRSWSVPAAEAAAFVEQADRIMRVEGRAARLWVGGRKVTVGATPVNAETPAAAPAM